MTSSHDVLALLRRWSVNWLMGADPVVGETIFAQDYELHIGAHTFGNRADYMLATLGQLTLFDGLMVTVHEVITNGHQAVLRLTEHGASTKHEGHAAAWRVIAIFESDGRVLTRTWAEEDYHARRRQLTSGRSDLIEAPLLSPWTTPRLESFVEAEDIVRDWIESGMVRRAGIRFDDEDMVESYRFPIDVNSGEVDILVSSGEKVGFHAQLHGTFCDDDSQNGTLRVSGLVRVENGTVMSGNVISDRLGLRKPSAPVTS